MSFYKKWTPSKTAKRKFAQKMDEIEDFCRENGIRHSASSDSYYFTLNNQDYRVSNHTIAASDRGCYKYDEWFNLVRVRESYHIPELEKNLICITASKTRIIEIYNDLKAGKKLNKRGYVVND